MTVRKLYQPRSRRAFTLLEMLIVVAIIVALAGIGVVYVLPQLQKSKDGEAKTGALNLDKALQMYYKDHDQYPTDPSLLSVKSEQGGPYIPQDALLDPWGKQFQIDVTGPNNNGAKPDVYTTNPEGKIIGNWGRK
jgi:general secretion pathway protein G